MSKWIYNSDSDTYFNIDYIDCRNYFMHDSCSAIEYHVVNLGWYSIAPNEAGYDIFKKYLRDNAIGG